MNNHQRYLLKLLGEIHELCRANGIDYSIACGTMIGAVRNRGFLPWDDDADIFMTYDNYCKFKEVCATQLPENRFLGTPDTQECYGHLLPRYISRDTTSFHTAQSLTDDVAGEVIDIFVLDPIADGEGVYEAYLQDLGLYTTLANYANVAAYRYETDPELYAAYNERMKSEGRLAIMRECEAKLASHFDDAGSRFVFRWQGAPIVFQRSWFDSYTEIEFEGTTVMSCAHKNECLTCYYGEEWMEVPRVIDASKHNAAGSLNFPYTEALEFYRPTYDRSELLRETEERRYLVLKNAPANNRLNNDRIRARAYVVAAETQQRVDADPARFARALDARDIDALADILAPGIAFQFEATTIGRHADKHMYRYLHPSILPVSDEILEGMLYVLVARERIRHASRLLAIMAEQGHAYTEPIAALRETILQLRAAMNDYEAGNFERAYETAATCSERYPFAPGFRKMACAAAGAAFEQAANAGGAAETPRESPGCGPENGSSDERSEHGATPATEDRPKGGATPATSKTPAFIEARERLLNEIAFGRAVWPTDGFFAKYEADLLKSAGRESDAHDLYRRAAESTRNGLVLLAIHDETDYWPTWMRKPAWARAFGIERRKNEHAKPLEGSEQADAQAAPADTQTDSPIALYLFDLLGELCALCEKENVPYVLHPATVQALCRQEILPESPKSMGIVVNPLDAARLAELCAKRVSRDRALVLACNRPDERGISLRYHGLDSLFVNLRSGKTLPPNSLYVNVWPMEAPEYPKDVAKRIRSWYARYRKLCRRRMAADRALGKDVTSTLKYPIRIARLEGEMRSCVSEGIELYVDTMKHALSLPETFVHSGQKPWRCNATALEHARTETIRSKQLRVPADIDAWLSLANQKPVTRALEAKALASTVVTYEQIVSDGYFDETYFKRNHDAGLATKRPDKILARFRLNFEQIKLAVQLKELSLALLPRKEEILELEAAGNWDELERILRPYVRCAKTYADAGEARFDDDLFRVLQKLLARQ